jgi:hypothetical protein
MGLLDALLSNNSGGGLFDGLPQSWFYQSPLAKPQTYEQPVYDAMGNSTGYSSGGPVDPFPLARNFSPPPTLFDTGSAPLAGFGFPSPQQAAPQAAPIAQQPPSAAPQMSAPQNAPPLNVGGGYNMPRVGSAADYTPQTPTDVSAQSRQPQPDQSQGLPSVLQTPSILGRIGNPDGLIARLTGNDSRSISQQNLRATFDATRAVLLQSGLSNQEATSKAMLAVLNPEAGKVILPEALSNKQQYHTLKDGEGNEVPIFANPNDQTVNGHPVESYKLPNSTPGFVTGPDGKPVAIPPGVNPKVFRDEVSRANAKATSGEKTEVQAKAEIFANKMELAEKTIKPLENVGTSLEGKIASGLPLGNYAQSAEYQKYKQASSNFITALLRQESGAAISKPEFDRYEKEYMPQPGDGAQTLAQKAEARRIAIEGMKKGAGPGYKSPSESPVSNGGIPAGWSVKVR